MNPPMLFPLPLSFSQEPHKTTRNFLLLPLNLLGKWEAISLFPHYRLTRKFQTNLEISGYWMNGTLGKEGETKGWGGCAHGGLALHCSHICPSTSVTTKQSEDPEVQSTFHLSSGQIRRRLRDPQFSPAVLMSPYIPGHAPCPVLPFPCRCRHAMGLSGKVIWITRDPSFISFS